MAELSVRRLRLGDGRGIDFGARVHNVVEIQTEGKGYVQVWEWGPDFVGVHIHGGSFRLELHSGNVFGIAWMKEPQRILVPAMMEEV